MKSKNTTSTFHQKNLVRIAGIVGLILLVPLAGNQFVQGWNWSSTDFLFAFGMLFGTGLALDFASKRFINPVHKSIAIIVILAVFVLIWVELAVDAVSKALTFLF